MPAVNLNDKTSRWPNVIGNGKDLSFIDKDLSCKVKNTFIEFSCGEEPLLSRERSKSDAGCEPAPLFSPLLKASQSPKPSPMLSPVKETSNLDALVLPPAEPVQEIGYNFCVQECEPNGDMMTGSHMQNMMAYSYMEPYDYYEGVAVDGMGMSPGMNAAYEGVDGAFMCQMAQDECFANQEMCMFPCEDGTWLAMDGAMPMSPQAMREANEAKDMPALNGDGLTGCMGAVNGCDQVMLEHGHGMNDMASAAPYNHENGWDAHDNNGWDAPENPNSSSTQSWADSWSGSDSPVMCRQEAPPLGRSPSPKEGNRSQSGYIRENMNFRDQDEERPERGRRVGGGGKGRGRGVEKEPVKMVNPENYTTVMLRNIPNKYTQQMLVNRLNKDFRGEFDFMYLPIDFKNKCNVGYGFINFRTPEICQNFIQQFDGVDVRKCLPGLNSRKVAEVTPARMQGKAENIRRLANSPVMSQLEDHPHWMPLVFDENGEQIPFPTGNTGSPHGANSMANKGWH